MVFLGTGSFGFAPFGFGLGPFGLFPAPLGFGFGVERFLESVPND